MRILIVTDAWHPQVNGVVRTLNAVAHELRGQGDDVQFITPEGRKSWPMPFYAEISLTRISARAMAREIREIAPDAIQIATEGPLGWAARRACLDNGWRFTTGFHTRFAEYAAARLPLPGVAALGWRVLKNFHAPSRGVMVPTPSIGKELAARKIDNVKVWTRGVDHTLFHPYEGDHLKLPRPILLYAGRLAVEKGINDFMALNVPGTKVLVGDGPEREGLARRFPLAHFLGFRHGEDSARPLSAADVMVFPSRTDTFGLVMLEAMACGTPVAAYNVPSPIDVIIDGQSGCLSADLGEAVTGALALERSTVLAAAQAFTWARTAALFRSFLVPARQPVAETEPAFLHLR